MCKWLGHEPFMTTHASDYFDRLYETAETDSDYHGNCHNCVWHFVYYEY